MTTDPSTLAGELSDEERRAIVKIAASHLWPSNSQPGCAHSLYRKGLTTSNGEFVPVRLTSAGLAVAKHLERSPTQPHSQTPQPSEYGDD
jgi:hypothetical protein